jgi:WD40 repeat protein
MAQSPIQTPRLPEQDLYFAYHLPAPDRMARFCLSEPDRHDFFIAYTFKAIAMVRALDEAIRAEGFKSWIGDLEALVSQTYQGNVDRGIRESDGFVLLAGAEGIPLDLQDELEQALKLNKLIFLLAHQPLATEHLNLPPLQGLQWAPLTQIESSYGFKGIARLLVHSLTYVRLLARALEWERQSYPNDRLLSLGDLAATQKRLGWIHQHLGSDFEQQPVQRQFLAASAEHIKTGRRTDYFQGQPPDVFISYSSQDRDFVKQLSGSLKDSKLGIWVDWENIPIATNWRDEVMAGIQAAHTLLFVISPHSVRSEHCRWELEQARHCGRRIIPLCCGQGYDPARLKSLELDELSYVSFEELPFQDAAAKVVTAIRTDLTDVKAYNRLYSKAYEWHIHQRDDSLLMDAKDFRRVQSWLRDRQSVAKKADGKTQLVPLHPLQTAYIDASAQAMRAERQQRWLLVGFTAAGFMAALAIAAFARLGEVKALVASLEEKVGLDGLVTALQAGKRLEDNFYLPWLQPDLPLETTTALHQETLSVREVNRLDGHDRAVFDVAFSPNGEMLVSTGEDHTIRPWTLAGAMDDPLQGDAEEVLMVDYSSDGDFFVTGNADSTVQIWSCDPKFIAAHGDSSRVGPRMSDSRYGESLKRLTTRHADCAAVRALEHPGRIARVAVSPGSQYVASASFGGNVQLWTRSDSFRQPRVLPHASGRVLGLDFSAQKRLLVSSDSNGAVKIWNLLDGTEVQSFTADAAVIDVRFSPDGRLVAIGGLDGLLQIWDWENNRSIKLPGHEGVYTRVMFSAKRGKLASADTDGIVNLWDTADLWRALKAGGIDQLEADNPLEPSTLRGHQDAINRIQFSPDGRYLASASLDDTVRIWLTSDGALLDTITGHQDEVLGISFSPPIKNDPYDENELGVAYLASSSRDGTIRVWRINNQVRPLPHENRIYDVAFRPDGKVLATGGRRNISLWRLSDHSRVAHIAARQSGDIFSVHYSPDGNYLVAGDSTGTISLWRPAIDTVYPHRRWPDYPADSDAPRPEVSTVRFSPNGRLIASGWSDGRVTIWDLEGNPLAQYSLAQPVSSLAFNPSGDRLLVATTVPETPAAHQSQQGQIQVLQVNQDTVNEDTVNEDTKGQVELALLTPVGSAQELHQGGILTVAFNPADPHQFTSGGADGTVKLWTLDGALQSTLTGHDDAVTRVDYSANGNILASSSSDSTIKLWQVDQARMISSLKRHKRQVAKVIFNPLDDTILASAGFDDQVLLWSIPPDLGHNPLEKLVAVGCESAERYLNTPRDGSTIQNDQYKSLEEVRTFCKEKAQN